VTQGTPPFRGSGWESRLFIREGKQKGSKLLTKDKSLRWGKLGGWKRHQNHCHCHRIELGLAVLLAYFGFSEGRNQLGPGKRVFGEEEKQLLEHKCGKEGLFPTANPQGKTIVQSLELLQ
jgi:hypothetical protein